jgi:hypothetical protein
MSVVSKSTRSDDHPPDRHPIPAHTCNTVEKGTVLPGYGNPIPVPIPVSLLTHPTHPHQNRTDSSTQMAAQKQHTTCLQPHEPLLMGWIAGGMTMPHCQDHWQGSGTAMGPNDNYIIWASDKFFFHLSHIFI